MLPIPIILVISVGSIVVTAITIESIYVSIRNVIQNYKKINSHVNMKVKRLLRIQLLNYDSSSMSKS